MDVSIYLKRPMAKGETTLFARISYNGNQLKYYLPEKINPGYWNANTQKAKQTDRFKEYPEFNTRLEKLVSDIKTVYRTYLNDHSGEQPTKEEFKELLDIQTERKTKVAAKTFFSLLTEIIDQSETGVRLHPKSGKPLSYHTIKTYKTIRNHLTAYQKTIKKNIDFKTIDLNFYNDYKEYLIRKIKLSTNTIGKHIQVIKLVMNEATERGINTNLSYKSKRFVTVEEKSDSIYLNDAEIQELANYDFSMNSKLERVRDLFLIGCYTGLRYSDYSILKPEQINDGFIETEQLKTGNAVVIPIHETVKNILDKYNGKLPKSISNQKTNEYLKEIGKKIGSLNVGFQKSITKGGVHVNRMLKKYDLLSTHTARRSFATNEYLAGTPTITIAAITGHRTEKSFLKYIKLTPKEHAKILKMHWQNRKNKSEMMAV